MRPLNRRFAPWTAAIWLLFAAAARGDLVVDTNLGILPLGATNVVGDTADGANNADYYTNTVNSDGNWGNELVYQFELDASQIVGLTLHDTSGDPDFFLLLGLFTEPDNGKNAALFDLDALFLDDVLPDTGSFGLLPPGTYYLSVDNFDGFDPPPGTPASATFDLDFTISPVERPADFIDLGPIVVANEPVAVDTFGTDFDTLLGVFDSDGFLIGLSDDAGGTVQSLVDFAEGLPTGEYFVGLGGFDTVYQDGFVVDPQPGSEFGNYVLNFTGGTQSGLLAAEEAQWFRFEVAVPEPSTWVLVAVCIMFLVGLARRASVAAASTCR